MVAGTASATAYRDPSSRWLFPATILMAAMNVVFFALSGTSL